MLEANISTFQKFLQDKLTFCRLHRPVHISFLGRNHHKKMPLSSQERYFFPNFSQLPKVFLALRGTATQIQPGLDLGDHPCSVKVSTSISLLNASKPLSFNPVPLHMQSANFFKKNTTEMKCFKKKFHLKPFLSKRHMLRRRC